MLLLIYSLQYIWLYLLSWFIPANPTFYRKRSLTKPNEPTSFYRCQPKPEWVKKEVLRLKAFMPNSGCRAIADAFNRLYSHKKKVTVGKSFVAYTIRHHLYEIQVLRKKVKRRKPRNFPKNAIWSMDLTLVKDELNQQHQTFGVLDADTRVCLYLNTIKDKSSITLLRCLLDMIERYGKPKSIRTDNERCFTSCLFRLVLWLLNIQHETTEVCCPWQNGRIERFFGTLKHNLKMIDIPKHQVDTNLAVFRQFYNYVRPHQNLNYQTPAEVWNKQKPNTQGKVLYFSHWFGALCGFYFPPD